MPFYILCLSAIPCLESLNSYANELKWKCLILVSSKVVLHGSASDNSNVRKYMCIKPGEVCWCGRKNAC